MKKIENMEKIKKVIIEDNYEYVSGKGTNGGGYVYTTTFFRENPGEEFKVKFGTSADFEFCPVVGNFQSCGSCLDCEEGGCLAEYQTLSEKEVAKNLRNLPEGEEVVEVEEF